MRHFILLALLFANSLLNAQENSFQTAEVNVNSLLKGTLLTPQGVENMPLLILIAGSGPTDRNGNQPMMQNNSLKYLAEELSKNGLATFRFDKRIIAQMKAGTLDESKLSFDDFVADVDSIISYFQANFSKIYLIGHSEGALIGTLAANNNVSGLVTIAGAGRPIDLILLEQIGKQAPYLVEEMRINFGLLREGKPIEKVNPNLISIFRPSVQNYMRSWLKYNPTEELAKLNIPILVVSGENDIQVPMSDGDLLYGANDQAEWVLITGMNHVLKIVPEEFGANIQSYNKTDLPVSEDLVKEITTFIKKQN